MNVSERERELALAAIYELVFSCRAPKVDCLGISLFIKIFPVFNS